MTEQSVADRLGERIADAGSDRHALVDLDVDVQRERGFSRDVKIDLT